MEINRKGNMLQFGTHTITLAGWKSFVNVGNRLANEIEQEQEIKEKGAVAIRRGDAVVLDWGKDSLIIPTKRWRELSKQGDCIANEIEAEKPKCLYCLGKKVIKIYLPVRSGPFQHAGKTFTIPCPGPRHQQQDEIEAEQESQAHTEANQKSLARYLLISERERERVEDK